MHNIVSFIIALGALIGNQALVNTQEGFVVVEKKENKIIFNDPILEAQMIEYGVVIPQAHLEKYGGRERIKLGEDQFFEAFKEFYSAYVFDPAIYEWLEDFSFCSSEGSG